MIARFGKQVLRKNVLVSNRIHFPVISRGFHYSFINKSDDLKSPPIDITKGQTEAKVETKKDKFAGFGLDLDELIGETAKGSQVTEQTELTKSEEEEKKKKNINTNTNKNDRKSVSAISLEDFNPSQFKDFKNTGLIDDVILRALDRAHFKDLTPIQQKSIVPLLETERGMVCRAKTGTGKTLTFLIPTLQSAVSRKIASGGRSSGVDTVIIVPTRDLALQIYDEYQKVLRGISGSRKPHISYVIGGMKNSFNPRNPSEIVIATPGRLEADLRSPLFASAFTDIKYRVYDEADRLLDVGFEPTLDSIDRSIKMIRSDDAEPLKSLLFSATVDARLDQFAKQHINKKYDYINTVPEDDPEVHENIHQVMYKCKDAIDKFGSFFNYVNQLVKDSPDMKMMVFLPTQTAVEFLYSYMSEACHKHDVDIDIFHLHGKRSASQRQRALNNFKRDDSGILITTDVAARGIDVKGVTHVVQLFPSSEIADYVHKVGRTGRAGKEGKAVLFITQPEMAYVRRLNSERGVTFEQVHESSEIDNSIDFFEGMRPDEQVANDFFYTLMSFLAQISSTYRLRADDLVAENVSLYRAILQKPDAKLSLRAASALIKRLNRDVVREFFEQGRGGNNGGYGGYSGYGGSSYGRSGGSNRYSGGGGNRSEKRFSFAGRGGNSGGHSGRGRGGRSGYSGGRSSQYSDWE